MPPEIIQILSQAGPVGVVGGLLLWFGWGVVQKLLADQLAQQDANREWWDKTIGDHRAETARIISEGRADVNALVDAHQEEMGRVIDQFRADLDRIADSNHEAITALTAEVKSLSAEVRSSV